MLPLSQSHMLVCFLFHSPSFVSELDKWCLNTGVIELYNILGSTTGIEKPGSVPCAWEQSTVRHIGMKVGLGLTSVQQLLPYSARSHGVCTRCCVKHCRSCSTEGAVKPVAQELFLRDFYRAPIYIY